MKLDYLCTLAAGQHTITILYTDGEAAGAFTVAEGPVIDGSASLGRGCNIHLFLWLLLLLILAIIIWRWSPSAGTRKPEYVVIETSNAKAVTDEYPSPPLPPARFRDEGSGKLMLAADLSISYIYFSRRFQNHTSTSPIFPASQDCLRPLSAKALSSAESSARCKRTAFRSDAK